MQKIVTKETIEFLEQNRIYFDYFPEKGSIGLTEGEILQFNEELILEPYVAFHSGRNLCSLGSFSMVGSTINKLDFKAGRYCSIAAGIKFQGLRHPIEYLTTNSFIFGSRAAVVQTFLNDNNEQKFSYPNFHKKPPIVENDVWIGQDVLLNDGIRVGNGAVVASNSTVTKDVMAYEIVGGNPAKLIRKRFDDETIDLLLQTEWWNYKFTDLRRFQLDKPNQFAKDFLKIKNELEPFKPNKIQFMLLP